MQHQRHKRRAGVAPDSVSRTCNADLLHKNRVPIEQRQLHTCYVFRDAQRDVVDCVEVLQILTEVDLECES